MPPYKKNGIPDRWTEYQAVGKRIPGTRFIAFKVPLNENLRRQLPPLEAFGPQDLVNVVEQEKNALGLVIDLTFTTRYYKPEELPEDVQYVKIFTAGKEVPSDPTILSFKRAVHRFLEENRDNGEGRGAPVTAELLGLRTLGLIHKPFLKLFLLFVLKNSPTKKPDTGFMTHVQTCAYPSCVR